MDEQDKFAVISVAEALRLPVLRRGLPDVVAAPEMLDRRIRWVHAGEVPNIASLLSGGELLLTTGMGVGRTASERRRFIAELAKRQIAALAVELGESLPEIPDAMRKAAEAHDLPLIALRRQVRFVEVTEAIHTALINRQYALLRRGEEINRELVAVMLEGEGLPEVLRALSRIVGNPVFLEAPDGGLLFHAGAGDDLDAWDVSQARGEDPRLVTEVPMGPGEESGRLTVLPIKRALTEADAVAIRQASGIVALTLLRTRQEEELIVRERGDLLSDLVAGRTTGAEAGRQAEMVGFAFSGPMLVPVAIDLATPARGPVWGAFVHDLQNGMQARGIPVLAGVRSQDRQLAMLVGLNGSDLRDAITDRVVKTIRSVLATSLLALEPVVAVGQPVDWDGAGAALGLAIDSAICARPLPPQPWHDVRDLEVQRLLWGMRGDGTLSAFVDRNLGPLLEHDSKRKLRLLPTLEALCMNNGRKAEAARRLHLNRQALYHRISRIEALLGVGLEDASSLMTLHVAIKALPYIATRAEYGLIRGPSPSAERRL